MYIYICMYIYIYIYIYICIHSIEGLRPPEHHAGKFTASFHNFKSQNFKLSVSNPKRKYVAYVSVLSQISNSQGLGRKNNFECLKTYRNLDHKATPPSQTNHDIMSPDQ